MTALILNTNTRIQNIMAQFGISSAEIESHLEEWLVLSLFTQERISSGKAAQLLNISLIEFLKLLQRYHINYFNYTDEELSEELEQTNEL